MQFQVKNPMPGVVYCPADRLRMYLEAGELPTIGLADAFIAAFQANAERVAIYSSAEPGGSVTYSELDSVTDRFAAALLRLGLRPLDRVLFQTGNSKELLFAFIGCLKANLIPVCTLAAHREREIGYLGCHADARAHIVQGDDPKFDLVEFALKMKEQIPTMRHVISLRGPKRDDVKRLEDLVAAEDAGEARKLVRSLDRDPFQVGVFQISGGTTGVPKIIPRMSNDYYLNIKRTAEWLGFTPEDVMFNPMPMIHNACMVCSWAPILLSGGAFIIPSDMTPQTWGTLFRAFRPTWIGMIRALMPRFETMISEGLASIDSIRGVWAPDAAPLFREKFGLTSYSMFGMSEGLNMYVKADDPDEALNKTVGRPISPFDEVRLVEPGTDQEVGYDTPGEFTCRGPYTLAGYYNAPERNSEAFSPDGFYRSGDLMIKKRINGETFYAFSGRTKDSVSRGHEKVNAEELEQAVASHASVADCAVVGMPDPVLGERICAFIIPKTAHDAPSVEVLGEHLKALGLAKFKWPERIEKIEALPLTKVGKLDKAKLRQMIADKLKAEEGA